MTELSSSTRFAPPIFQARAESPLPSPRRYGRSNLSSEESHFRDISPSATLRAFTEIPIRYSNPEDRKIFSCIETATPAEKDLGLRVAKAAQRLKSWCQEIEQWGWSGTFETPSAERREERRKSVQGHINEHTMGLDGAEEIGPLEYWGSLLSAEVKAYEARIDEIEAERDTLDIEELKGHILDIHGPSRSRPSSSYDTKRPQYLPLDDFSLLVTQTLLQALPHLSQLKMSIDTWSTRLTILSNAQKFLRDLGTTRKALDLAWRALDPPLDVDASDTSFNDWKETLSTLLRELRIIVSDLGQRLDRMLDILEGREDALPDMWIDDFEELESDYSRWTVESRNRILEVEVRRIKAMRKASAATNINDIELDARKQVGHTEEFAPNATDTTSPYSESDSSDPLENISDSTVSNGNGRPAAEYEPFPDLIPARKLSQVSPQSPTTLKLKIPDLVASQTKPSEDSSADVSSGQQDDNAQVLAEDIVDRRELHTDEEKDEPVVHTRPDLTLLKRASVTSIESFSRGQVKSIHVRRSSSASSVSSQLRDRSNSIRDSTPVSPVDHLSQSKFSSPLATAAVKPAPYERPRSPLSRPQTPQSGLRRDSVDSVSSSLSLQSSSPSALDDSPSVRNAFARHAKVPRPPLNSAMAKRRPVKDLEITSADQTQPWPPTKFAHALSPNKNNSAEDLERKISDILTTIPARIRFTSGPEADAPEIKPHRIVSTGRYASNANLRAPRNLKSPEPTLTLSPVKNDDSSNNSSNSRRAAASGDSDIKLYHLTQSGKDNKPIKLFVRRVGENGERVMVRVGGGWADLGEYLRQYAEHHGRRTVSESKFEVLGLENPVKSVNDLTSSPAGVRPGSRLGAGTPIPNPVSPGRATPAKATTLAAADSAFHTPASATVGTPANGNGEASSASTGSSRLSWGGAEVGLAGPKAKKLDLSGEKLEWIEGMISQARNVSGQVAPSNGGRAKSEGVSGRESRVEKERERERRESKGEKDKERGFGDLGRVGGTKRVFLRGGKAVGERPD